MGKGFETQTPSQIAQELQELEKRADRIFSGFEPWAPLPTKAEYYRAFYDRYRLDPEWKDKNIREIYGGLIHREVEKSTRLVKVHKAEMHRWIRARRAIRSGVRHLVGPDPVAVEADWATQAYRLSLDTVSDDDVVWGIVVLPTMVSGSAESEAASRANVDAFTSMLENPKLARAQLLDEVANWYLEAPKKLGHVIDFVTMELRKAERKLWKAQNDESRNVVQRTAYIDIFQRSAQFGEAPALDGLSDVPYAGEHESWPPFPYLDGEVEFAKASGPHLPFKKWIAHAVQYAIETEGRSAMDAYERAAQLHRLAHGYMIRRHTNSDGHIAVSTLRGYYSGHSRTIR